MQKQPITILNSNTHTDNPGLCHNQLTTKFMAIQERYFYIHQKAKNTHVCAGQCNENNIIAMCT